MSSGPEPEEPSDTYYQRFTRVYEPLSEHLVEVLTYANRIIWQVRRRQLSPVDSTRRLASSRHLLERCLHRLLVICHEVDAYFLWDFNGTLSRSELQELINIKYELHRTMEIILAKLMEVDSYSETTRVHGP